jgi:peroxiredoxin Q/BCP
MLKEGDKAPDFTLPATGGNTVSLSDFRGQKNVVLYFYPKDNSSGCSKEATSFRDLMPEFEKADAVVLGVSADSLESHEKFARDYSLPFPLLSDESKEVSTAYGVFKEKNMYGRKVMGIERTTLVIDKEGVIRKIWPKVKVEGHAEQVLDFVKTL